ncbi:branched-chain amino acid ABC transporter permease [Feifania hominis]|uniref:Branched-chain amino acid ABC transporter permease n=1 Tax=Feifania hominis TaxID=2763660 RepID=A0A926HUY4_9FIRM|nr:branched-chain amino acid ABC transporter permease [Feifania hominis]MBC8536046.1 branched-chain amino acid ABC transporter permease [Feifania hominis]
MRKKTALSLSKVALGLALVAALTAFCNAALKNSQVNIINTALIFFFCVSGQYLLLGLGGMLSMCSVTFLGTGAFFCAFLNTKVGVPIIPAMLAGAVATMLIALILGLLLLKLSGPYFMFGTMGVIYIGTSVFQNFTAFTGGPNGTSGIEKLTLFGYRFGTFKAWVPLLGVLAVVLIAILYRIKNTSFGRSLMAVRDDTTAAVAMGVNVYRTKVIAFTFAGLLAGLGGALYAVHNGTISASLFTFGTQTKFIIMLMLGGVMSPVGALCGTVMVNFLPEIARSFDQYLNLIYGIMIIILMIFMPMGLAGLIKAISARIRHRLKKRHAQPEQTERKEADEHAMLS